MPITPTQLDNIRSAHAGQLTPDAQIISEVGLSVIDLLLRKNSDYGSSAFVTPVLTPNLSPRTAIQCRMSDKIARLATLLASPATDPQVTESVEDTMRDLAGYAILWLACPEKVDHPIAPDTAQRPPTSNDVEDAFVVECLRGVHE